MTLGARADNLTEYVQDRVGSYYLGTVTYDANGYELRTVAGPYASQYDDEVVAHLVDLLRDHHAVGDDESYPDIPAGKLQTAIYVLEHAIVLHYMPSSDEGIAVAIDPEAGRNLFQFVMETREQLQATA